MSADNNFKYGYLNIHTLISHSASSLNRDNNGLQKSMLFGGVKRARISSQSLKYAIRNSRYYSKNLGQPTDRTRELLALAGKYVEELSGKYPAELVMKTMSLLLGKDLAEVSEAETSKGAIIPWSIAEVAAVCEEVQAGEKAGLTVKQLGKNLKEHSEKIHQAFASSVDMALSGRMTTSGVMEPIDGSMALAHSFTTHHHENQLDWFTAVDSFTNQLEGGKTQAGHIGTQDFATGTFYRYCSLNLEQLNINIGKNKEKALDIAAHLVYLLATVVPGGKQNSFAAFNLAEYVLCSFSDQPISLADAFEKPIKMDREGGYMSPSIKALQEHFDTLHQAYGVDNLQLEFNLLADSEKEQIRQLVDKSDKSDKSDKNKKAEKVAKEAKESNEVQENGKSEKLTIAKLQNWVRKEGAI